MAEILLSPGVSANEVDTSFVTQGPITAGAAIIGPTVKGPVEIPTVVTSYAQYQQKFGDVFQSGSPALTYTYFTSIAARNYFDNGGTSLLVARVVTGSYSSATSSLIVSSSGAASPVFVLETISEGTIMNSAGPEDSAGALASGSANNVRWEITATNTSSGTFALLIRQGNDTTNEPTILEQYTNLSLDPYSPDFISRRIGDKKLTYRTDGGVAYLQETGSYGNVSAYVRVKSVNITTPNYFLNSGTPNPLYTGSLPINASGSFGGALGQIRGGAKFYNDINSTDTQGLTPGCYDRMVDLLANTDDYKFNVLTTPGLCNDLTDHAGVINDIISSIQNRGDAIYIPDMVSYGKTITDVVSNAAGKNTSYAATYWPWVQVLEPNTNQLTWIPASTVIPGVYAYNDSVSYPWFAPAGLNRGSLSQVIGAERNLSQANRDTLYNGKVNPIATLNGQRVVYGQKTLQTRASALDRVNVRRLLIALKSYISQVANTLVFEQNTATTRNNFLATVNPYLESVQQQQGLYAFRVIMDDSNNTASVIDQNQLVGQIYVQPTKTAEFIYLDFIITPTGATFPA
jgi:hypothetical protein